MKVGKTSVGAILNFQFSILNFLQGKAFGGCPLQKIESEKWRMAPKEKV